MKNRIMLGSALGTVLIGVVLAVTVGGAFAHTTGATPLPAATCSPIAESERRSADRVRPSAAGRWPLADGADDKGNPLRLHQPELEGRKYTIAYQSCDDSTAQAGKWDSGHLPVERHQRRG